jgi:hypothetical protein
MSIAKIILVIFVFIYAYGAKTTFRWCLDPGTNF